MRGAIRDDRPYRDSYEHGVARDTSDLIRQQHVSGQVWPITTEPTRDFSLRLNGRGLFPTCLRLLEVSGRGSTSRKSKAGKIGGFVLISPLQIRQNPNSTVTPPSVTSDTSLRGKRIADCQAGSEEKTALRPLSELPGD